MGRLIPTDSPGSVGVARSGRPRFRRLLTLAPLAQAALALADARLAFADAPAAIRKGPYLQDLSATDVVVRIETEPPAPATLTIVEPGHEQSPPRVIADRASVAVHSLRATGLSPRTRYTYEVRVGDAVAHGELTTAPPDDTDDPLTFLVYGDNRTDAVTHAAVVRAMAQTPADFLVNTGDVVSSGRSPGDWQTFFDVEEPLLRERCVFACVGNHELVEEGGASYLRYFGASEPRDPATPPRLYGSFRWGRARFFLLDGMDEWASGAERAWLDDALTRADGEAGLTWRFAVVHQAPWSSGPHGGNPRMLQARIPELFARHQIDAVFAGHDHIYERGYAAGVRYVVSGGGGAPLYRIEGPTPSARKAEATHHFIQAKVEATRFTMTAKRIDGSLVDRCGFTKGVAGWDCDPEPSAPSPGAVPAVVSTQPPPASASRCGCTAVGAGEPPSARGLAVALGAFAIAAARRRRR